VLHPGRGVATPAHFPAFTLPSSDLDAPLRRRGTTTAPTGTSLFSFSPTLSVPRPSREEGSFADTGSVRPIATEIGLTGRSHWKGILSGRVDCGPHDAVLAEEVTD